MKRIVSFSGSRLHARMSFYTLRVEPGADGDDPGNAGIGWVAS